MKNTNTAFSVLPRMCKGAFSLAFIAIFLAASRGNAQTTISIGDSSLQLNQNGVAAWTVNGVNQLSQQSFWYSVNTGSGFTPVEGISTISSPSTPALSGFVFDGTFINTNYSATYANSTLGVTTFYTLEAQGSGSSLASSITVNNPSSISESIQFYQYSDFVLEGISGGQNVQFAGIASPYTVTQTGNGGVLGGYLSALGAGTSVTVGEVAGSGNFGLANGGSAPNFSDTSLGAAGSVDFAYEFSATVGADSSITISELQTVPEPSSMALVSCGLLGIGFLRRGLKFIKKL